MRLPRDLSGEELAVLLGRYDYEVTRQTGGHLRLATTRGGEHHVTIPHHKSLRVGTLSAILRDVPSTWPYRDRRCLRPCLESRLAVTAVVFAGNVC